MFKKLQHKWGVSNRQFRVLFLAFALTGTTTAILTRYVTAWFGVDAGDPLYVRLLLRLAMLLVGYQVILLFFGALLGEWAFFWKYEKILLQRIGILKKNPVTKKVRIAIFASGTGTNAEKIIGRMKDNSEAEVAVVACNREGAGVIRIAIANDIPVLMLEKERFFRGDGYVDALRDEKVDFIVLAGFLWKVPSQLVKAYEGRIINIHPALLPKYGGKGMYGTAVHEAVIAAGEQESGITIHYVNEKFDEGAPIFQARCKLSPGETAESLAAKIHELEHLHFPEIVLQTALRR